MAVQEISSPGPAHRCAALLGRAVDRPVPAPVRVPVLLIAFNRPGPVRRVFSAIRQARPERLYIALDGPREDRADDERKIAQVRDIVAEVDWPCQVARLYRQVNLGCRIAVSQAISWFFEHEERGIILEDDTLPEPRFFRFAEAGLHGYENSPAVGAVCGYNILGRNARNTCFLASYPHIWGWATWRRVWRDYQVDLKLSEAEYEAVFRRHLHHRRAAEKMAATGRLETAGQFNSWDLQFGFLLCRKQLLSLYPPFNLVLNIGFGPDATHTLQGHSATLYQSVEWPADGAEPVLDREYDQARFAIEFPGRWARVKNLSGRLGNRLFSGLRRRPAKAGADRGH